jgi:hypothetical protein
MHGQMHFLRHCPETKERSEGNNDTDRRGAGERRGGQGAKSRQENYLVRFSFYCNVTAV